MSWEDLWSIVGKPLPEDGLPSIVLSCMRTIEESDASAVYHSVSGYGATTSGEGVDSARIIYTYYNQLNPALLPPEAITTLCTPGLQWDNILEVLGRLPANHYSAMHALLRHCYCVSVTNGLAPELLGSYYHRAIFKTNVDQLRVLLTVLIMNYVSLGAPNASNMDEALRPMISEIVNTVLSASLPGPTPEEIAAQHQRVYRTFGPCDAHSSNNSNNNNNHNTNSTSVNPSSLPLEMSGGGDNLMPTAPPVLPQHQQVYNNGTSGRSQIGSDPASSHAVDLFQQLTYLLRQNLPTNVNQMNELSLKRLKSELKHRIHEWEQAFEQRYHRPPAAADKQPVRDAYDVYKNLKQRLEASVAERQYNSRNTPTTTGSVVSSSSGPSSVGFMGNGVTPPPPAMTYIPPPPPILPNTPTEEPFVPPPSRQYPPVAAPIPPAPPVIPAAALPTTPTVPTLEQLRAEKHTLKRELHEFENSIRQTYGRAPTKEDRRLMFERYARYGELKQLLQ